MLAKKPKGATEKRKSSSVSGLLWMFVGAVLTLMIGVFIYLSPLFNFSPADGSAENDSDRQVQPRVDTDTDNGDYEFYDILRLSNLLVLTMLGRVRISLSLKKMQLMMVRRLLLVTLQPAITVQQQGRRASKLPNLQRPISCRSIALVMQMKQIVAVRKY